MQKKATVDSMRSLFSYR